MNIGTFFFFQKILVGWKGKSFISIIHLFEELWENQCADKILHGRKVGRYEFPGMILFTHHRLHYHMGIEGAAIVYDISAYPIGVLALYTTISNSIHSSIFSVANNHPVHIRLWCSQCICRMHRINHRHNHQIILDYS